MAGSDDNGCQAGVTPAPSDFARSVVARDAECIDGVLSLRRLPLALSGRGSKVRVLIQRAIILRARLEILLLGWPVIGNGRALAVLERDHAKKTQRCALCHRAAPKSSRRGDKVCSASSDATSHNFLSVSQTKWRL
jgi:hypothetical protein